MKKRNFLSLALIGAMFAGSAFAQTATTVGWEQLNPTQRDLLTAQIRERWDKATPEQRTRWLEHASKWSQMTPEQRAAAHKGRGKFQAMSPAAREARRAVFYKMQSLKDTERKAFLDSFFKMSEADRLAWVKANPAPANVRIKMPKRPPHGMGMGMPKPPAPPVTPPPAK